jgi:hypothetical protein
MNNILLLNQDWFAPELRELGFNVVTAGHKFASHLEVIIEQPFIHIDKVIEQIPNNFVPDCLIVLDNSAPIAFSGIEDIKIPTIFYSVDTHHHSALHRYLCDVFDYNLIAQKDYIPFFNESGHFPEWFPLWASRYVNDSNEKKYSTTFVGTMNPQLNPERVKFFEEIQKKIDVFCTQGEYWNFFPYSEIVINQTVKSDLNFRVFEAMMCGPLLLTESSTNGLFDLFKDGEHLVTYSKNNVDDAVEKIKYYLENKDITRKIAKEGREEILRSHTPMARAKRLAEIIINLKRTDRPNRYASMAVNYLCTARSKREIDPAIRLNALTHSLRCFEQCLVSNQSFDDTLAAQLVVAAVDFDRMTATTSGYRLLKRFFEAYPNSQVLLLATVRGAMNLGELDYAKSLCTAHELESPSAAYSQAENVVQTLMQAL